MAEKNQGIVSIHGKDYKTVACRLSELHELFDGNYTLKTELLEFSADSHCVMKATLGLPVNGEQGPICEYTGHAFEKTTTSQINKTSHLENAETSAIGRALASAGFLGSEFASADEVANAIGQQKQASASVKTEAAPITPEPELPPVKAEWRLFEVTIKRETEKYTILTLRGKAIDSGFEQTFDFFQTEAVTFDHLVKAIEDKSTVWIDWKKSKQFEKYKSFDIQSINIQATEDIPF